ncbi:hypothetical protein LUZ60_011240 [Juncus effusus]|nr:hypothetical protein LUZ60_011240 [Juncus effusus]
MKYRQLALQIHPDKNKHQKADSAFKLVLEAYSCLSDKTKRRYFDSERRKSFCMECYTKFKSSQNTNPNPSSKTKTQTSTNTSEKSKRFISAFKEFQNRLKEECKVIENCLRNNKKNSINGYPLFNPNNKVLYPNYPHFHGPLSNENAKDLRNFHASGVQSFRRRFQAESPVYKT